MSETIIDLSHYHNALSRKHQVIRMLWSVVWRVLARPLPRSVGSGWFFFIIELSAESFRHAVRSLLERGTEQRRHTGQVSGDNQPIRPVNLAIPAALSGIVSGINPLGIPTIHDDTRCQLLDVVQAADLPGFHPSFVQRRQQHGRQDGDDRNHHQKLDQCKQFLFFHHFRLPFIIVVEKFINLLYKVSLPS